MNIILVLSRRGLFTTGGHLEIADCLIKAGANPSAVSTKGAATPLAGAADSGCVELVEFLLRKGAWDAKLSVSLRLRLFSG